MFARMIFEAPLPTWAVFLEMILGGAVVVLSGSRLTRLADEMADRLNLGSGWIGLILLATVTSLPELVTGSTAVGIGNPDLAFAAIFGSCSFNITLIVLLNAIMGGGSVLRRADTAHVLTSSFGAILMGVALFGILLVEKFSANARIAQPIELVWAASIFVAYVVCMKLTFNYEHHLIDAEKHTRPKRPLGSSLVTKLVMFSLVLVTASWWPARTGDVLSEHEIGFLGRPLGATLVGACFLALATSLPEIATSIVAVRIGNLNMALGNIFGSNMFNIFTIPFFKIVSMGRGDALLVCGPSFDASQNLIAGVLPMILTALAVAGLIYRSRTSPKRRFGFDSVLIGLTYLGGMILLVSGPGS